MAMDGRYAENAGAFFGGCLNSQHPEKRRPSGHATASVYAENAGAILGGCVNFQHPEKRRTPGYDRLTGTPEMQEQFPAGAWMGRHPESEGTLSADALAHPRIQLTSFPRKRESILICAFRHLKEEQHGFPLSRE
jgi:hypothetical protein